MKYIDEYRDPAQVKLLLERLQQRCALLPHDAKRPLRIMEVCGGHTHAIFRYGLDKLLPDNVEFIHGPGCPVCVLPMGRIDTALDIARHPDTIFCTFGDAIRVPGLQGSLTTARSEGADVRMVYSPMDALALAAANPDKRVVFFGIGFETTMPATAITLQQARARGISNFFLFCQHITLAPTLRHLLEQPDNGIDAFLAPGHVTMVIGKAPYTFICEEFGRPLVVAGFEPVDMLHSVLMLVEQVLASQPQVENQYKRVVPDGGNPLAIQAMNEVFEVRGNAEWRGLGEIVNSGVRLRAAWQEFDAERQFNARQYAVNDSPDARCGEVLTGRCKPNQCPLFGNQCQPQSAFGALMVSSEGACAAWYQYRAEENQA